MTGPEHYQRGERLLAQSEDYSGFSLDTRERNRMVEQAKAHFLAARVAVIAEQQYARSEPMHSGWAEVFHD